MLRRVLVLSVIAALGVSASASARTNLQGIADPATAARYAQWLSESHLKSAHVTVRIEERSCTEYQAIACIHPGSPLTLVFPDLGYLFTEGTDRDRTLARSTFLHEMGHIRDMAPRRHRGYRARFARIMQWRDYYRWDDWARTPRGDKIDPREQFAMAYQFCAMNPHEPSTDPAAQGYGYEPTVTQHRRVCWMLQRPWR